ncbi:MAG: pyridoxal phosphate-dependent aminotransferase [Gemmatimonadaceae bacterium]
MRSIQGSSSLHSPIRPLHALSPNAHRGRVSRGSGLRVHPIQPRRELDARPRARRPGCGHGPEPDDPAVRRPPRARLRELLAAESGCTADQVLLTPGAAGALFVISTSLLSAGDHLVVLRPNYATNIETPRAIGCDISYVELSLENGFRYTAADIAAAMTPQTRLVSITNPHNPTGTVIEEDEVAQIAALVSERGGYLLVDETYRDLTVARPRPFATTLSENVISVASLSKAYGLPGLRVGWLMARDRALNELFLAAKEQMVICGPVLDEEIAYRVYRRRTEELPQIAREVRRGVEALASWMATEPAMEWVRPSGGVVAFPRIRADAGIDVPRFYETLNGTHGTFVGPGHWFEQDDRFMRIGFGWPSAAELEGGLYSISASLAAARI